MSENGVHGSASPLEALGERMNWMGARLEDDAFGSAMIRVGIPSGTIRDFVRDPQVPAAEGHQSSLFDLLEDLDATTCLQRCQQIHKRIAARHIEEL